ncbi:MAG: NifU family protein [Gloeomargarita sp. SKYGB_i_bin116]|nr:NifU family protein [Gloeomargarita sp. SKYGB_i_bin116]
MCRDVIADLLAQTVMPPRLTTVQKINRIQAVLSTLRPYFQQDGGDVELVEVEGDQVWVQLTGACGDCSSRWTTLKEVIEARLRQEVWPTLVVEAVS